MCCARTNGNVPIAEPDYRGVRRSRSVFGKCSTTMQFNAKLLDALPAVVC